VRVVVEKSHLIKAVSRVHRVAERRNTVPILSNILLRTEGNDKLLLKATDLEIGVSESLDATVESMGGTTVPAYIFHDIVRKLPEGTQIVLALQAHGDTLEVRSGGAKFLLQTLQESAFADMSVGGFSHEFCISGKDLKHLLDFTHCAMSSDETRYQMSGVYLHSVEISNGTTILRAVATDGHRLAKADIPCPQGAFGIPSIIIPKKAVLEIQKLIDNTNLSIPVGLSSSKLHLKIGPTSLTSKLVDSSFPNYIAAIPQDNNLHMTVGRIEFSNAVDRVASIASETIRAVSLKLTKDKLSIQITSSEYGSALEELPVKYDGKDLEIGFNARYLIEIANQLKSEEAIFKFSTPTSAALVHNNNDDNALHVVMPMQV